MNYETGTMNRTVKPNRVIVPPTADILNMHDEELIELRANLVDAQTVIEAQIASARASGDVDPEWLIRSSGALAHMRRGLTAIKGEMIRRTGHFKPTIMPTNIQPAFEAIDVIKDILKNYRTLMDAVNVFLDDDNDDNYNALCAAVGREP